MASRRLDQDDSDSETASSAARTNRYVNSRDINSSAIRPQGQRVEWSSDDDEVDAKKTLPKPKTRPKQKQEPVRVAPKRTATSMVGRKPKRAKCRNSDPDGHDDETIDDPLPAYMMERKQVWERHLDEHGDVGVRWPPQLDLETPSSTKLETRPDLPEHIPKHRPCEPVDIGYDAGTIPAPIAQYLRPYQIEGADFLYKKFLYQEGGILGDDMGLGKTIQVIAFLTAAFGKNGISTDFKRMRAIKREDDIKWYPRVLIICPGTLMFNWKLELERWGYWHVYICHGNRTLRDEALGAAEKGSLEIMITTYDTYKRHESAINCIPWDCVIADECHIFKQRTSETAKAMLNVNALCRFGLSGTVIQNNYEELWTLLNWANPGKLGPIANWKAKICIPLRMGQSHDATLSQLSTARRIATKLVKNLLPKFFLRRNKTLIADQLPKKSDRVVFCPLTSAQADAYNEFTDTELVHRIRDSGLLCACGSGLKSGSCCNAEVEDFGDWRLFVFPVLNTLRKLSNHLALMLPSGESDKEKVEKELRWLKMAVPERWEQYFRERDNIARWANSEWCGKWRVLKKLLHLWNDNGDKVLIFSTSVKMLDMLRMLFQTKSTFNVSYLTGSSMSPEDRHAEVEKFNSDESAFVFLISTRAGGVGLNITSANKVVIMDPNWNPAWDMQAQDRAFRIGQTRDVEVFRLVSSGTVEEIVYARQIYKQQQANIGYNASVERRYFKGVQNQKENKGEIFGLANLFAPLSENVVLRDIVNKTNIAETRAGFDIVGLDLEPSQQDQNAFSPLADEKFAMSELAAEIVGANSARKKAAQEQAKKKDPVQAILASAGVQYTHENAEVIGTSKIEMKISSRAMKAGDDVGHVNELAFGKYDFESQIHHVLPTKAETARIMETDTTENGLDYEDGFGKMRYKYNPPGEVRKRQFCTMARQYGYDDVSEFAFVVEGWTQEQRRDCLEKFYKERRRVLAAAESR